MCYILSVKFGAKEIVKVHMLHMYIEALEEYVKNATSKYAKNIDIVGPPILPKLRLGFRVID